MRLKLKNISDQVIVITGASSGIGLTTAELAAARGARVVLNARNEQDLRQACDRIRSAGGRATYYAGDVADPDAMQAFAATAIQEFGGFDTWVNDAGTSKHAVKAYTDALRMELEEQRAPVSVTLVKPGATNTMFIDHARTYMDADPDLRPPVYAPEEVAHAILRCAERPTRDVTVGGVTKMNVIMGMLAPRLTDSYMERKLFKAQKKDSLTGRPDALYEPTDDGSRRGSTEGHELQRATLTRVMLSDAGRVLPYVAIGGIVAAAVASMRRAA